jgi:hypothetical protein
VADALELPYDDASFDVHAGGEGRFSRALAGASRVVGERFGSVRSRRHVVGARGDRAAGRTP